MTATHIICRIRYFFLILRSLVAVKNYRESYKFPVVCEVVPEETEKILTDEISAIFEDDLKCTLMIVGLMLFSFLTFLTVMRCIKCKNNE